MFSLNRERLVQHEPRSIPARDRVYWFLANHSCAFQYWQRQSRSNYGGFAEIFRHFLVDFTVGSEKANDQHLFVRQAPAEIIKAKNLFKLLLLEIARLCNDNHSKLLLSVIPTKIEYDGSRDYSPGAIADYLETVAAENNIPFLNLVRALAADESDPLKIFIANEYHLNDYGHAFVAKHLVPFFISNQ